LGGSALLECVVFGRVAGANCLEYLQRALPSPAAGGGGASSTTTISIPQPNGAQPITITTTTDGGAAAVGDTPSSALCLLIESHLLRLILTLILIVEL
jgi:hypothetical protein